MQISERSALGYRVAEIEFTHPEHAHRVLLLPMVHLATAEFYEEVNECLRTCDYILKEGVGSFSVSLLTLSYRIPARSRRLGLVLQSDALNLTDLKAKVIGSDVSVDAFSESWSRLPWWQRLALYGLPPCYGAYLFCFGTRQMIAPSQSLDDYPSRERTLDFEEGFDEFNDALLTSRDRQLRKRLGDHLAKYKSAPSTTAVLFGEAHMPALVQALIADHGYRNTGAKWRMAIPFD